IANYAWMLHNSRVESVSKTFPVGTRKPNDFGLFDMHGNLMEQCQDAFSPSDVSDDDSIISSEVTRVIRNGAYVHSRQFLRSSERLPLKPDMLSPLVGFRPVRLMNPKNR